MPAHRCDHQQLGRILRQSFAAEALQVAEGAVDDGGFLDRAGLPIDLDRLDVPAGLFSISEPMEAQALALESQLRCSS
jgi:hypothetical protein